MYIYILTLLVPGQYFPNPYCLAVHFKIKNFFSLYLVFIAGSHAIFFIFFGQHEFSQIHGLDCNKTCDH